MSACVIHRPPAVTVSIAICSPSVECNRSDMPAIILLASIGCGASGCWRANASKPLGQHRGALGRAGRGVEEALDAEVALADAPRHQVVRADDDAEHVVEVVGDAAGELADRLHLLRLAQLAFDLFAPADLLDELHVGRHQLIARGCQRAERLPREARDQDAEQADQHKRDGDADLQQHADRAALVCRAVKS